MARGCLFYVIMSCSMLSTLLSGLVLMAVHDFWKHPTRFVNWEVVVGVLTVVTVAQFFVMVFLIAEDATR